MNNFSRFCLISVVAIFVILTIIPSYAQQSPRRNPMPKGSIKGFVYDAKNSKPVEYANVVLYRRRTNEQATGTITDSNGFFSLTDLQVGLYLLEIKFIGFKAFTIDSLRIRPNQIELDLGRIEITPDVLAMGSVEVLGEKPIIELEQKITELEGLAKKEKLDFKEEIKILQSRLKNLKESIFANLTPWQRVQLARHPERPKPLQLASFIFEDFLLLHGDRLYGDDQAIIGGLAKIGNQGIVFIGHQKGESIKENLFRNFGMAHPEGYRKAQRLMNLAEKLHRPILTFIDTPGAYPGIEAEERGQAEAIAANLERMSQLKVPILVVIIGEGGSGGALGIGVGDRILMLENAIYSVISPEGCAAILWKDQEKVEEAAKALHLTSQDLFGLGLIDEIISEPRGGAHRDPEQTALNIKERIIKHLEELKKISCEELVKKRYKKYREIGKFKRE